MNTRYFSFIFCCFFFVASVGKSEPLLIGHFQNAQLSDGEDVHIISGYSVNLYRDGMRSFGDIDVGIGTLEAAKATLHDIVFDPRSRKLTFCAKYSIGQEFGKDLPAGGRKSAMLMKFSGIIKAKLLIGTVETRDWYRAGDPPTRTKITLKRTRDTYVPASYDDWANENRVVTDP